jgi:hypothetical protein
MVIFGAWICNGKKLEDGTWVYILSLVDSHSRRHQGWNNFLFYKLLRKVAWSYSTCFFIVVMPLVVWQWNLCGTLWSRSKSLVPSFHYGMIWLFFQSTNWLLFTLKWLNLCGEASKPLLVFWLCQGTREGQTKWQTWH